VRRQSSVTGGSKKGEKGGVSKGSVRVRKFKRKARPALSRYAASEANDSYEASLLNCGGISVLNRRKPTPSPSPSSSPNSKFKRTHVLLRRGAKRARRTTRTRQRIELRQQPSAYSVGRKQARERKHSRPRRRRRREVPRPPPPRRRQRRSDSATATTTAAFRLGGDDSSGVPIRRRRRRQRRSDSATATAASRFGGDAVNGFVSRNRQSGKMTTTTVMSRN